MYMQQRYYDPVAGRFLSVDPVVTDANTGGSFNRYVYTENNPYRYIDSDGRQAALAWCFGGPGGCAVGVGLTAVTAYYGAKAVNDTQRLLQSGSGPKRSDKADSPKTDDKKSDGKGEQRPSKTPNEGVPGSTHTNPGSGQEREYGADGKPVRDTDYDHDHGQGVPHIHD